jgi:hypothetical protein
VASRATATVTQADTDISPLRSVIRRLFYPFNRSFLTHSIQNWLPWTIPGMVKFTLLCGIGSAFWVYGPVKKRLQASLNTSVNQTADPTGSDEGKSCSFP